jgi:hypothetical protein
MNSQTQTQSAEEEKKTISLDRYGAQDIADAIESLAMTEVCLKNNMPACEKYKSARVTLGRNYVKFYSHSKRSMITVVGDVLLIIRGKKHKLVIYGDTYFRLFEGDKLVAKSKKLTWDGTEEIYTAQEFFSFIKRTIRSVLDVGWL